MCSYPIVHRCATSEDVRTILRETPLTCLREMIPDDVIIRACREHGHVWRERLLGPVATVHHFLLQAIQREESFAATRQELWARVASELPEGIAVPDASALTRARARLPLKVLTTIASSACRNDDHTETTWHGFHLKAIDGCSVSMPCDQELVEHFGLHGTKHGIARYPLARFVSLLRLSNCTIADWQFGLWQQGESTLAQPLIEKLEERDLVLIDRGFTGGPTLARIRARGAMFLGRKTPRLRVDKVKILRKLGRRDWIVELPVNVPARKRDSSLPETVVVRLFRATWTSPSGERLTEWFETSLQDRAEFPPHILAALYHERWLIETSYLEFKQAFHTDVLRSRTVDNIYKEFAAHVLAYQLVRRLITTAAVKHNKKPKEISFINATRWTLSFSRIMASALPRDLPRLYRRLLETIAAEEVNVRPGRSYPRVIARERKHFPRLHGTRAEYLARIRAGKQS